MTERKLSAQRLAQRFATLADSLDEFAERGRPVRGGLRELTSVWPYIIRYRVVEERVVEETVVILRIPHGAQEPD